MAAKRLLGAVLAGGKASRFGSDKALAELDGTTLIELAVRQLAQWCDAVVIVGRGEGPAPCVPDWPAPEMGPLAGLAGALRHGSAQGFDLVLTCGVDSPGLPDGLPGLLAPAPSCLADQPVIGLWPAALHVGAEAILASNGRHSMRRFAEATGARWIEEGVAAANINRPEDLAAMRRS